MIKINPNMTHFLDVLENQANNLSAAITQLRNSSDESTRSEAQSIIGRSIRNLDNLVQGAGGGLLNQQ